MNNAEMVGILNLRRNELRMTFGAIAAHMGQGAADADDIANYVQDIQNILNGKRNMSLMKLCQIADALQMDVTVSDWEETLTVKQNAYWPIWKLGDKAQEAHGWKMSALGRHVGIDATTINIWYECRSEPRMERLMKYLDGLGLELRLVEREAVRSA